MSKTKAKDVEITVVTPTNDDAGDGTPTTTSILGDELQETVELVNEPTIIKNRERNEMEIISGRILLNLIIVFFSVFLDMMGVSVVQPGINIY